MVALRRSLYRTVREYIRSRHAPPPHCDPPTRLQPALEQRRLPLGTHCDSARSHEPGQVRRPQSARARPRPRASLSRRSAALRRLRHARKKNSVRSFPRAEEKRSCVIRRATTAEHAAPTCVAACRRCLAAKQTGRQTMSTPTAANGSGKVSLQGVCPARHAVGCADIEERSTLRIATQNARKKSGEGREKSTCKKVGSPVRASPLGR
jgi:hypothetical protein